MIAKLPFGKTGHLSTRVLFGAAALARMRQEKADAVLETLLEFGINHIDTAASYGDSELRLRPWLADRRDAFFLASKTGERSYAGALASIERSRERLQVDQLDLIQLHNLVDETEWETALGPGGALDAAREARERGWVRHIGITGHGTRAPEMHLRSLERFAFDSVLAPYNFAMLRQDAYAQSFDALYEYCQLNQVALQTIKAVARRRWDAASDGPRFSWYEPLRDPAALERAVHFALARPGVFLNTSSDVTLLRSILSFASAGAVAPAREALERDLSEQAIEPLFAPGLDGI